MDTAVSDTTSTAPPTPPARPATILAGHILFTLLHATLFANILWLMPLLVRLYFGSDDPDTKDWQTTLVTAAVPTFLMLSIFWAELLRRVKLRPDDVGKPPDGEREAELTPA